VQAAYEVDAEGQLRMPLPARCPLGEDGSPCRVLAHHRRERKSGPEHPVAVCRCHTHGVSFTVYPPGHVPYGRIAMVAADSEGRRVRGDALGSTVLSAVLDASEGEGEIGDDGAGASRAHRRTQGRRIGLCAAIVGIGGVLSEQVRGRIADALSVPLLTLRAMAQTYAASRSMRERAGAVRRVLKYMDLARRRIGLLVAGHFAGLWGRPSYWDPCSQMLRALV
jgi:hypothetical protein